MGMMQAEQAVEIIEAVAVATQPVAPTPAPAEWWQVVAILAGAAATLLTAYTGYIVVKRRKKK